MYILRNVGKEGFGIWALVGIISSYAQLSDFGITEGLIKFIAEYDTKTDTRKLNELLNTSFVLYLFLSIIFCPIFLSGIGTITDDILNIPIGQRQIAIKVFSIAVILFFVNMISSIFGSMLIGFQRMDCSNSILFLTSIINAIGTVIFLRAGYGLIGLIYNNAFTTTILIAANYITAKKLFPAIRFSPISYFNLALVRKMFDFSWKIQITSITQLFIFQIDRILLSHYLGLIAVSNYELASRIASQARNFIVSIFTPMIPAASSFTSTQGNELVAGLYRRSFKYMASIAIPLSFLLISLSHSFIRTWIGPGNETSAYTLQILAAAYIFNVLTGPGSFIMTGINKPHINMRASVLAAALNVTGCVLLIHLVGYYGIILSIFLSVAISGVYFLWTVQHHIPGATWDYYRKLLLKPIAIATPISIVLLLIDASFHIRGYFTLSVLSILFLFIFVSIHLRGKYFDEFDIMTFRRIIAPHRKNK